MPDDKIALATTCIFTVKWKNDGTIEKYKARIVAGGHKQKAGIDFKETFVPVAKFVSLRTRLTMAAVDDLEVEQVDIITAFLYDEPEEVVYVRAPVGINHKVGDLYKDKNGAIQVCTEENKKILYCLLKCSLYRLKQYTRYFYRKLDETLGKKGYVRISTNYGM